jgi:hypothetical protein
MVGRKMDGNHSPPKNNLIQDLEGNEKTGTKLGIPTKQR